MLVKALELQFSGWRLNKLKQTPATLPCYFALSHWWNSVCRSWIHPLVSAGLAARCSPCLFHSMHPSLPAQYSSFPCFDWNFLPLQLGFTKSTLSWAAKERHSSSVLPCEAHAGNSCSHTMPAFPRNGTHMSSLPWQAMASLGMGDCSCTLWTYLHSYTLWEIVRISWEL